MMAGPVWSGPRASPPLRYVFRPVASRPDVSRPVVRYGLAAIAGTLATYPLASIGAVVLPPDPFTQVLAAVPLLLLGVGFGAWYARSERSVRRLGRFVVALYVVQWALLLVAVGLVAGLGVPLVGPAVAPAVVVFVLGGYAAAYWLVFRRGWERLRG